MRYYVYDGRGHWVMGNQWEGMVGDHLRVLAQLHQNNLKGEESLRAWYMLSLAFWYPVCASLEWEQSYLWSYIWIKFVFLLSLLWLKVVFSPSAPFSGFCYFCIIPWGVSIKSLNVQNFQVEDFGLKIYCSLQVQKITQKYYAIL